MQDFFTYYIRQQTILADVTVGCQSNSRRVSSISDLLAPDAKSSAGGTACSRLPWPAVLPHRPHHPTAGQAIPLLTHIPPLLWLRRLRVIPFLGLAVVHRAGVLGTAWSTLSTNESIGRGMYMERLIVGTHMVHGRTQAGTSLLRPKE